MKDVPENELFSAYLDGELTAEEQAQVEQLLAESPPARRLFDELRAISSALQAMPRYKLGEDISRRVLRLAELSALDRAPQQSILRRVTGPWALVSCGLAVAAAVMLMVMLPSGEDRPKDDTVALTTATDKESGAFSSTQPDRKDDHLKRRKPEAADRKQITEKTPADEVRPNVPVVDGVPSGQYDMVLRYWISPEANRRGALGRLLVDNGITGRETRAEQGVPGGGATALGGRRPGRADLPKPESKAGPVADAAAAEKERAVYVEATRAQMTAVLAALKARPEAFRLVSPQRDRGQTTRDKSSRYGGDQAAGPRARQKQPPEVEQPGEEEPMLHVLIVLRIADLKAPVAGSSIRQEPDAVKAAPNDSATPLPAAER